MWGMGRIKAAGLAALMLMGLALGPTGGLVAQPEAPPAKVGIPAVQQPQPDQAAMLAAVRDMLQRAHVPPQDMPRRIIAVTATGQGRYKVHMQMVNGEGWFELTWDGKAWQVKGLPAGGTSKR